MQLITIANGVSVSGELRDFIQRCVDSAFAHRGEFVRRIRLTLIDVNGPRHGEDDIVCRVQPEFAAGTLIAESRADNPFAAVARACDKASHALARQSAKRRSQRRRRSRRPVELV